ncbi:MAG: glycosyltransferase family 4 protein [Pseudomonadales bacterium]|nr:glycosyltransferase family 4 protein [Pseudomonadales bacterium]
MLLFMFLIGVFLLSLLLTGIIRLLALRRQILDVPQSRSAHSVPTPVGGGLSVVLLLFAVSSVGVYMEYLSIETYLALYGAFLVAVLGLLDDLLELRVSIRVSLQILAAAWSLYWRGDVAPINMVGWQLQQPVILGVLALFALVWLLNLYNFMDGTDGIAGTELVFVATMATLLTMDSADYEIILIASTLAAAAAGFLVWNWAPAKIFMGDVGSGFSGFVLGLLALLSMAAGVMSVWTWLVLLGVFVTDATLTLLRRAAEGKRWYEGHSSHAYQHLARRYKSHAKVTITLLMVNLLWLTPLAYWTTVAEELGLLICLLALTPLAFAAHRLGAGIEPATEQANR